MRLEGRTALVTGSSRGIGAAIARKLAADGARVVVHGRSNRDEAEAVAESIRESGGTADVLTGDLAVGETAVEIVRQAFAFHGGLDVLVLNAGGYKGGMAIDLSPEVIDSTLALNLRSTILAAGEFARRTRSMAGRVIFISSGIAASPAPAVSIGVAAKAGAEAFMRALAQELGPRGITCNTVAPGCTRTGSIVSESWTDEVVPWTALRRIGEPEDIADVVGFLASDEARWLTGQTIAANGGLVTSAANILVRVM